MARSLSKSRRVCDWCKLPKDGSRHGIAIETFKDNEESCIVEDDICRACLSRILGLKRMIVMGLKDDAILFEDAFVGEYLRLQDSERYLKIQGVLAANK